MIISVFEPFGSHTSIARIVIDEAHCVSHLGHDYRPDYQKLSILRQIVPGVPIMALSATCPKKVLLDILKILRMKPTVNGNGTCTPMSVQGCRCNEFTVHRCADGRHGVLLCASVSQESTLSSPTEAIIIFLIPREDVRIHIAES